MKFLRRHPYLISLAALLVVFPVPALAFGEEFVYELVVGVFGLFVRLAAMLLNVGVNTFVIDFGGVYANTGVGYAVDTTWIIIRDFVNMFFIFGFVYIGFKMILNSSDSNTRRWLVNLLMAALLVNFSLFATKLVVDFSNQIAAQIVVGGLSSEYSTNDDGLREVDLGQSFMDRMGITSIFGIDSDVTMPPGTSWGYIFGSAILFMITAFVFAAGGILLIIRFAVLNLFLVLSPLMFVSWVLPPMKDTMNRYWSMFLGRVFFAPIYLLFIYFSLQIITGLQTAIGDSDGNGNGNLANPDWAGTFQAAQSHGRNIQESTLGTLPFFVLICVFMIASLVIAQKIGADGGSKAVALGQQLRRKVQRGVINTGKFAAAQTGGRLARAAADNLGGRVNNRLQSVQQGTGLASRIARTNWAQNNIGGAAASMQNAQFGMSRTRVQDRAMRNTTNANAERRNRVDAAAATPPITAMSTPAEITARQEARGRLQNEVRGLTNEQILERARMNREEVMSEEFASLLSDAQVTALRNSGVLTNEQSDTLETNRDNGTFTEITETLNNANSSTENLTAAMESLNRVVSTMSNERLTNMVNTNHALLTNPNVASRLSSAQVDSMRQSGNLTAAQMNVVTNARNAGFTTIASNGSLANPASVGGSDPAFRDRQRRAIFRNAQDAGKLPAAVLGNPEVAELVTPQIIEAFLNNNPSQGDIDTVRTNIEDYLYNQNPPQNVVNGWNTWSRTRPIAAQFGL